MRQEIQETDDSSSGMDLISVHFYIKAKISL